MLLKLAVKTGSGRVCVFADRLMAQRCAPHRFAAWAYGFLYARKNVAGQKLRLQTACFPC